jgi:hypothetical protein
MLIPELLLLLLLLLLRMGKQALRGMCRRARYTWPL